MRRLLTLFFFLALFSCSRQPKNKIIRVELARSGAWSDMGAAVSVDSLLNYNYWQNYSSPTGDKLSNY